MYQPTPRVVAEAGQCKGSVDYAVEAMEKAHAAGCWATKIQLFHAENIARADADIYWEEKREEIKDQRTNFLTTGLLDYGCLEHLMKEADRIGTKLLASPFDFEAIDAMAEAGMHYCKIASGDITNEPFVQYAASKFPTGIILSTGAADANEISDCLHWIRDVGAKPYAVLACTLSYPTPLDGAELGRIRTLREVAYQTHATWEVGYSDHTRGWMSAGLAVAAGASILEKHYTLDQSDKDVADNNFALNPNEMTLYVNGANVAYHLLGTGSLAPTDIEQAARTGARRSICAWCDIPEGELISPHDLTYLRPHDPKGFAPSQTDQVINRIAAQDIAKGELITPDKLRQ